MKTSGRPSRSSSRPRWTTTLGDLDVAVVDTNRGPVEVATCGEGPAVVLLHGVPGNWRQCVPLAEDLSGHFRTILISRPGYGRTPIATGRSYDEQADAAVAVLDAFGIDRCAMFGISGGGPAAIAAAARHHERVDALVMACAMAPHLVQIPRAMRPGAMPVVAQLVGPLWRAASKRMVRNERSVTAQLVKSLTAAEFATCSADPRIRHDLVRNALATLDGPYGYAGLRNDLKQAMHAIRSAPPAYDVACPSLLLYGGDDTVIPLEHGRFYADAIGDAELAWFEGAGHVFALTRRSESSAAILAFLDRSL